LAAAPSCHAQFPGPPFETGPGMVLNTASLPWASSLGCWPTSLLQISQYSPNASVDTSTPSKCIEVCNHVVGQGDCAGFAPCGAGRDYWHQPLGVVNAATGQCSCSATLPSPNDRLADVNCAHGSSGTSTLYYKPICACPNLARVVAGRPSQPARLRVCPTEPRGSMVGHPALQMSGSICAGTMQPGCAGCWPSPPVCARNGPTRLHAWPPCSAVIWQGTCAWHNATGMCRAGLARLRLHVMEPNGSSACWPCTTADAEHSTADKKHSTADTKRSTADIEAHCRH
jgi:hypothetical protein